jgi:hypothetical protein
MFTRPRAPVNKAFHLFRNVQYVDPKNEQITSTKIKTATQAKPGSDLNAVPQAIWLIV